ncbi:MAG: hypothetical protein H7Y00_05695 [Fimbriimonadaceae bacterium]|nr:hypothetical protein [Chitinophagales bacterium]
MKEIAQIGLLSIFSLTIVFHLLILLKIIPYTIVWGARLKSDEAMYKFEIVSITLHIIFLFVVLFKSNYLILDINGNILNITLWIMAGLFLLNTVGNLFSKNKLEKSIFTPVTILLTIFAIILALN